MTTHPATPDQSNPVGKTPATPEALISELEYAILGAQFAGNFDRIRAAKDALRAALSVAAPAVAPKGHIWHITRGQLRGLIAELQVQVDAQDGDPAEADETELCLSFSPAGTVHDDESGLNAVPLLTLWEAEYPEEGVYPIDPSGCAAPQPSHPTRNMDSTAGVPPQAGALAVASGYALGPLPTPDHRERIYGGEGNETVHSYFSATQMREYARQAVYQAEHRWSQKAPSHEDQDDLDAWHCDACCGKGWNWESHQVAERKSDQQEFKTDCPACSGTGWLGPDAEKAALPPQAGAESYPLSDETECDLQFASRVLEAIANRAQQVGDVIEPVSDIRHAQRLAKVAFRRISRAITSIDATAALRARGAVPSGWKLVPVEPTVEMLTPLVHHKWPADWDSGKKLQSEQRRRGLDYEHLVPPKTEYEIAVGQFQRMLAAAPAAPGSGVEQDAAQPRLTVRLTSFPESNGRTNWTALIVRSEPWDGLVGTCGGVTLAHGELWNRVAYMAERARFLLGERNTEPHILDYGDDIRTPDEWKGEVELAAMAAAKGQEGGAV